MTDAKRKPREWWILETTGNGLMVSLRPAGIPFEIHVIEHSAFVALERENAELKELLNCAFEAGIQVTMERDELRAKLEVAVSIFTTISKSIAKPISMVDACKQLADIERASDEALAKLKADGGGE